MCVRVSAYACCVQEVCAVCVSVCGPFFAFVDVVMLLFIVCAILVGEMFVVFC